MNFSRESKLAKAKEEKDGTHIVKWDRCALQTTVGKTFELGSSKALWWNNFSWSTGTNRESRGNFAEWMDLHKHHVRWTKHGIGVDDYCAQISDAMAVKRHLISSGGEIFQMTMAKLKSPGRFKYKSIRTTVDLCSGLGTPAMQLARSRFPRESAAERQISEYSWLTDE